MPSCPRVSFGQEKCTFESNCVFSRYSCRPSKGGDSVKMENSKIATKLRNFMGLIVK